MTDTRLEVPALATGQLYQFRLRAFNLHVVTAPYPGFAGPSPPVVARPIPAPAQPASFALLQPRVLFAGAASAGSTTTVVVLGPSSANMSSAYTGAYLRVLDAVGDMAPRQVAAYDAAAHIATVDPPLGAVPLPGASVEVARYPVSADVSNDGMYLAAVGFPNQADASRYQVRGVPRPWCDNSVA